MGWKLNVQGAAWSGARPTRAFRPALWLVFLGLLALLGPWPALASDEAATGIVGDWLVESRDAVIRIERVGDQYQGYILWQLHDTYGPEDGPELNGKTVLDRHNPDPALRSRPLTGLRLLTGLQYDAGAQKWRGGHIYDSEDGRTYNCLVRLISPDGLVLRGYVGISLLGGNTTWSRVTMRNPALGEPPYVLQAPDKPMPTGHP